MASITEEKVVVSTRKNHRIAEFFFTLNNYRDIFSLNFAKVQKLEYEKCEIEFTLCILFHKLDDNISSIVHISRTGEADKKAKVSCSMLLHNVANLEYAEVLNVSTVETEKGWNLQKNIEPLLPSKDSTLLKDGNLDVKFALTVFDCYEGDGEGKGDDKV